MSESQEGFIGVFWGFFKYFYLIVSLKEDYNNNLYFLFSIVIVAFTTNRCGREVCGILWSRDRPVVHC